MGDGGEWLREQCLIMAQGNHTPISFWLSLSLIEFIQWIRTNNRIVSRREKEREYGKQKRI